MILYFSGTGNSRLLAKWLAESLSESYFALLDIISTPRLLNNDNNTLGLVFPVYAWGVPPIVEKAIIELKKHLQKPQYIYAILSCGDSIGKTDLQLRKILLQNGWNLNAIASIIMPETYVALPCFKLDTQERAEQKNKKAKQSVQEVSKRILHRDNFEILIRGHLPWVTSHIIRPFFNKFLVHDKYFSVQKSCIHCQTCSTVCPVNNITYNQEKYPIWKHHCTGCLACYHHCPVNAIHYLNTKNKGQYTPPLH